MRTIKIGSASDCEIWFDAFSRKNSVWAIIEADEKGILILHRIDDSVRCFVNDNEVADAYGVYKNTYDPATKWLINI